jgi:hypothetical protein
MGCNVKKPKMLLCYGFQNGITNEKEDVMFVTKLELFSIGTISLPENVVPLYIINTTIDSIKSIHTSLTTR